MMDMMDVYGSILQSHGHKITKQREAVLTVLLDNVDSHLKAEDIYQKLKDKNISYGLATIYRALTMLSDIGIVDKVILSDGIARYKFVGEISVNSHKNNLFKRFMLICTDCEKNQQIEIPDLDKYLNRIIKSLNKDISKVEINFYSKCDDCSKKGE